MFVGRATLVMRMASDLRAGRSASLVGARGIGKTSLLRAVQRSILVGNRHDDMPVPVVVYVALDRRRHKSLGAMLNSIIEELVNALRDQRQVLLDAIRDPVRTLASNGRFDGALNTVLGDVFRQTQRLHKPILLFDDVHRVGQQDWLGELASILNTHTDRCEVTVVLAGREKLSEHLRDDTSDLRHLIADWHTLAGFTESETRELINLAQCSDEHVEGEFCKEIHRMTGGHPFRLHYYLSQCLSNHGEFSMEALRTIHTSSDTNDRLLHLLHDENVSFSQDSLWWHAAIASLPPSDASGKSSSGTWITAPTEPQSVLPGEQFPARSVHAIIPVTVPAIPPPPHAESRPPARSEEYLTMIKILCLAANPKGTSRLRIDEEMREIESRLRSTAYRDRFDFISAPAARVDQLQEHLMRHGPSIVHFSGHGGDGAIMMETPTGKGIPVEGEVLGRMFRLYKQHVKCVVLNACETEVQAQAIAREVGCVVAMSASIPDNSAITFAATFYQALGYGRNVKDAFEAGRLQIELTGLSAELVPRLVLGADPSAADRVFAGP
ncbi:MAG: AAA family ATPase [Candidatus Hydrogenedentes bacterium]|nr:AAA family ATPase [Candidatus Hydrogenedentota bacterium]